ncbi:MAG: YicC family protein [Bdellovibrionaceae bacterium]|nr:YicC family protein [Pseudobdellovibrionaceae bacterium]
MKSMTGFGAGRAESPKSQIDVSLRAVNGRFLETRFHLPREFHPFESDLKKMIDAHFERGTLDIFVSRKVKVDQAQHKVVLNRDLAKQYLSAYKQISKDLKLRGEAHVESIARLPDVLKVETEAEVTPSEKKALLQAFEKACKACEAERRREGKSVRADLEKNLNLLEKEIALAEGVREEANQNLLSRFEQKIKSRLQGLELDSARLSQEVVLQIDKTDINEEITRLREHIKNYRHLLAGDGPQGKKLDFYTQELLREVNTMGSKSSLSKLTQIVVDAKTNIERLREQVQNVE